MNKSILTKDDLFDMQGVSTFYTYLALGNTIIFNNGLTDLELSMNITNERLPILAKNLSFPELEPLPYDDILTLGNILGIIDRLKNQPSKFGNKDSNLWQDIQMEVADIIFLNKINYKER